MDRLISLSDSQMPRAQTDAATTILVLGMHRSGTSAVTRMLNLCGADLGRHLLPPKQDNERGFWENKAFLELHEHALANWGLRWHDLALLPDNWRRSSAAREFAESARLALDAEFRKSRLITIKDPRLCLLAPLWVDTLRDSSIRPTFVVVVRHPDEVAASLARRDGLSIAHSRMLWLQHMIECVRVAHGYPHVFVQYAELLCDWRTQLDRIQNALEIDLPARNADSEAQIDAFIEPSLRHHRTNTVDPDSLPALPGKLYDYLLALCADKPADPASFVEISALFDSQLETAGPLIRDLTANFVAQRAQHDAELNHARRVIHDKDDEIARARTAIQTSEREIERSREVHKTRDEREALLRNQLDEERIATAELHQELATVRASRDHIEAAYRGEVEAARGTIDALAAEIDRARATIDTFASDIDRARTAHRARDITERVLLDEITAIRASRWFRFGRALHVLAVPQSLALTTPTPNTTEQIAASETLHFALDTPVNNDTVEDIANITGWCFDATGNEVVIRIRCGDAIIDATRGVARPDVAAAFAECPGIEACGFAATLGLAPGRYELLVEAKTGHGAPWRPMEARTINARAATLRAELDTPVDLSVECGPTRISGWCVHPRARIMDLCVKVADKKIPCQYNLERLDVGQALPDTPGSTLSGFEATLNLLPGNWPFGFTAVLEDGSECAFDWPHPLRVRRKPLRAQLQAMAAGKVPLVLLAVREGRRWFAQNRRLPRLHEIPQLLRLTRDLHKQRSNADITALLPGFDLPGPIDRYTAWQDCNRPNAATRANLQRRIEAADELPRLSIIMPVYSPPLDFLRQAVDSVASQSYENWELCIADDASPGDATREYLADIAAKDSRVRLCLRQTNGNISAATNSAAALATGDFLVFMDQDDLLAPDALAEIALGAVARNDTDIIYSDDDKIDTAGHRFAPQFKPDWSPELLLGYMYFSHVFAVRRSLFDQIGGMRLGFEGSQDYDFALRASEQARTITHIPQVLYHWRVLPGSTAASGGAKPRSFEAGLQAVADAVARRGIRAEVLHPEWAAKAQCGIFSLQFPDDGPRVAILIPTRNGLDILSRCIDSLRKTTYANYEILVIDNDSDDAKTIDYLCALPHRVERISNPQGRFNYAFINNRAAELVDSDLLVFLNNDTEISEPRWLSQMVGYAQFHGVGAVGARLLYPDKRIQHAGIVHGYYGGLAGPAFKLTPAWDNGYLSYARVARNYLAVTAACMLTPRKTFLESGGFDEINFEVAYNDVDYCYRLANKGLRSVYCADAELIHHEGHSRGFLDRPQEIAQFRHQYAAKRDPYYNPHLSVDDERFVVQPRHWRSGIAPPIRVLMCAFNLNWEGAPYSQLELTLGLKRGGFIDPIVFSPQDGPLRAAYEKAGINVHVAKHPLAGVHTTDAYDAAMAEFAGFIRGTGADLVYGNTLQTFYAIDAARRCGLPSLWNPRESEPWQTYFNFLPAPLAARALCCFEYPYRVIFVANATRRVWEPLNSRCNFMVIHNGLNPERLEAEAHRFPREVARRTLNIDNSDIVIFLPGTVCERKGQQDLIQALQKMPLEISQRIRCFIVGDRPSHYSATLHQMAQELPARMRERVHIVPETDNIVCYYLAADVFVCTSRVESFPRVVLEAMFFGLPVLAARVFGVVEQVHENVNALLYDPGDTVALARHLQSLIDDDALRERMASNSPHVLATLNTYDEMVEAYGEVFREAALTTPIATESTST